MVKPHQLYQNFPFPAVLISTLSLPTGVVANNLDPDETDLDPKLFGTDGIPGRIF